MSRIDGMCFVNAFLKIYVNCRDTSKIQMWNFLFSKESAPCFSYLHVVLVYVSIKWCFFLDNIFSKHIESVYIVCNESFCLRTGNFLILHYLLTNTRPKFCLHNIEFLHLNLAHNSSSIIQIFGSHLKCTS